METKEDRIAIMRWENETGPTAGKNRRPGERTAALSPGKSRKSPGKALATGASKASVQTKMQGPSATPGVSVSQTSTRKQGAAPAKKSAIPAMPGRGGTISPGSREPRQPRRKPRV